MAGIRRRSLTWLTALSLAWIPLAAWGQPADAPAAPDDPMARPTEYGVRLTPEMARAFSKMLTRKTFVEHYKLDESRADEVSELVARRLMQTAHTHQKDGRAMLEYVMGEMFAAEADAQARGGMDGIPRELGMGIGKRLVPLIPAMRELVGGISQDVRPMLPLKQQLKMAGELMAFGKTLDVLEKNMHKWAEGDVNPHANPFEDQDKPIELDENGESKDLKRARERAEQVLGGKWQSTWEKYVEDAKAFYAFDEGQQATADSILRETIQQAERIGQDPTFRDRLYRAELWSTMLRGLARGPGNPLEEVLSEDFRAGFAPISRLGDDLKERIDGIPTEAQRRAAEARVAEVLLQHGFDINAE